MTILNFDPVANDEEAIIDNVELGEDANLEPIVDFNKLFVGAWPALLRVLRKEW